jgi:DNA-binding transcriptional regulator YiaG
MEFGEQVKQIRQSLNLSQMELADKLSVSFSTVNRWENGHSAPSKLAVKSFLQFCADNNVDVDNRM